MGKEYRCEKCEHLFTRINNQKYCCPECAKQARAETYKRYNKSPKGAAKQLKGQDRNRTKKMKRDQQMRRIQIALQLLIDHAPSLESNDVSEQFVAAWTNGYAVLSALPTTEWTPYDEGTEIDEPTGDVYIDGIWQPGLVAVCVTETILSEIQETDNS